MTADFLPAPARPDRAGRMAEIDAERTDQLVADFAQQLTEATVDRFITSHTPEEGR